MDWTEYLRPSEQGLSDGRVLSDEVIWTGRWAVSRAVGSVQGRLSLENRRRDKGRTFGAVREEEEIL